MSSSRGTATDPQSLYASRPPLPHTLDSFVGTLVLDTRELSVHSVNNSAYDSPLFFTISLSHRTLSSRLSISLSIASSSVLITYSTSPFLLCLQWLSPPQTTLGKPPFVFTQCQAIRAQAIFSCQDTLIARIRYSARFNIFAVMSARNAGRHSPFRGEAPMVPVWDELVNERVVEKFVMNQPLLPYLFYFVVGKLYWREIEDIRGKYEI